MKQALRILIASFFVLILPIELFLVIPKLNGFTVDKLKTELNRQHFYDQLSTQIQSQANGMAAGQGEDSSSPQISSLVTDQLTPTYLQTKINDLLDQTADWATKKTTTGPTISFNDLKTNLMNQGPAGQAQVEDILAQLKQAADQHSDMKMNMPGGDSGDGQQLQQLLGQTNSLDAFAKGDWNLDLSQPLAGIPLAYQVYSLTWPILAGLLLLALIGFILLEQSKADKLRGSGLVILLTGLWNGILAAAFTVLVLTILPQQLDKSVGTDFPPVMTLVQAIKTVLFASYLSIELWATSILVVMGIGLMVASQVMKRSTPLPPQVSKTEAADSTPIKPSLVAEITPTTSAS